MAKTTFEMSWNYTEQEYKQFLAENKLVHLKSHGDHYFKAGDALRSEKGVIARIMNKFNNYENYSHDYTIANNKLSQEEMDNQFLNRQWSVVAESGCPHCGSYEGDYMQCPECGHGQ